MWNEGLSLRIRSALREIVIEVGFQPVAEEARTANPLLFFLKEVLDKGLDGVVYQLRHEPNELVLDNQAGLKLKWRGGNLTVGGELVDSLPKTVFKIERILWTKKLITDPKDLNQLVY
jgi:hypothetical protein